MRILLVLLLTMQINSLKADEIFNLVKIPNLEVYKLNNANGIKYLNAKKDFRIGVNDNIKCDKSNKKSLDNKFPLISKNLETYDAGFLKKTKAWQKYHKAHHTSTFEIGKIAQRIKPNLLILSHILFWGSSPDEILQEVKSVYDGNVVIANDLMVIN